MRHTNQYFHLKWASFVILFLITATTNSSLLGNSDSIFPIEQEIITNNIENELITVDTPQAALSTLTFENEALFFIVNEKGYIDYDYFNLWYADYYHDYYWMCYLSINDGDVTPLDEFLVVKTLTKLTEFVPDDFTNQLVAETIIRHPYEDVYIKNQIKLYPNEEFFVMTFHIWSDTIDINKAELFIYNDIEVDEYYGSFNDNSNYDASTELIYQSDKAYGTSVGWISTIPVSSWDMGVPVDLEPRVLADNLGQEISLFNKDLSLATKYQKDNLLINETWVVPLIYGFAPSTVEIYDTTVNVKDNFINDFSVLNFTTDITDDLENVSVQATILNGGQNRLNRTISVYRNGTSLASENITLSPGETGIISFDELLLFAGVYNELTVSVNDMTNDYVPNNNQSHNYLTYEDFRINFKDIDGFDEEGLKISLFDQTTQILENSAFTNEYGNVTYSNLPENDYTLRAYAPWVDNRLIHEENFTFNLHDKFYQVNTNMTTLNLQIQDVAGFPVNNASINITKDDVSWFGLTDSNGNVTFQFLNQTYDVAISYYDYDTSLVFSPILGLSLSEKTYYSHQISLTNLTLHFETSGSQENLTGAKVEFYERIDSGSFGNLIGFDIADSNGNVSIRWSSLSNYSIRVSIFSEYKLLGVSESHALNYTNSPYIVYIFDDIEVSLGGSTLDQYTTDIVQLISPTSCTWGDDIDFQFMFNVSGPDFEGPLWANETFITIRNQDSESVYDGNATNIVDQIGNHSFIINSSSGHFSGGETYTVNIFAQIYGYQDPTPEIFSLYIRNVTTDLVLHSSSEALFWKENFTISANYVDTTHGGILIADGELTVTWGSYLIDASMQNLGNGTYTIETNSSLGSPGNSLITIDARRDNYDEDDGKFSLTVREVPTTVNGSILFDSRHSQYVTTQNITLDYNFIDSYRNISVPELSPMYQLIHSETDETYTGYLTFTESGGYFFDPHSALLPIGNYHGLIEFSLENYLSSYASVQIEVLPIPTSINDTSIPEIPYELLCYSSFQIDFEFTSGYNGIPIEEANATFFIENYYSEYNFSGTLAEMGDFYRFDPKTEYLPIGTYSVNLFFEKSNHTQSNTAFTFEILAIPTSINDTSIPEIPYELLCYSSFRLDFEFTKEHNGFPIEEGTATFLIEDYYSDFNYSGNLTEITNNLYRFEPQTENLPLGTYSVNLFFDKANHTQSQTIFTFVISEIPLDLTFEGGGGVFEDDIDLLLGTEFSVIKGENFYFSLTILDIYGNPVLDCNISYRLNYDNGTWLEGTLITDNMGHFSGNFSEMIDVGLYSLILTVQKTNYTSQSIQAYLNVEYPKILGISLPYLIIGGVMLLITITGIIGYAGIRQARIPRYIKDLNKLEKIIKNPNNILPDRYLTRIEQLKGAYGNRWEQVDISFPLKQQTDEIKPFVKAYQTATGRMLLNYEAKHYLDDLMIYSEEEIRARLKKEHIPMDHISILVEIILTYSQIVNSGHEVMIDSKINNDFDLDDLELSTKGDE